MTVAEIAEEHGVSRQTIHTYRRTGVFPSPVEGEGSTRRRFREDEVAAFFKANPKQPRKKRRFPPEEQGAPVTTTVDPRIAILSALNTPPYDDAAGVYATPLGEAAQLLDAYRAKVLREVADEIEGIDAHPNATGRHSDIYKALAHRFRRQADEVSPGPEE
jgi:DNA-binding transcriptional MerR regulator